MADRYDLKVSRRGKDGKNYSTRIGVAWPMKNVDDGFNLIFEALPVPQLNDKGELEVRVAMWPPYEDADKQKAPPPKAEELDDEIPF
jgi:hypothetical protein